MQALEEAQAQPHRMMGAGRLFKRVVPRAFIDIGRAHLNPVRLRIPHELRGGIKAHGLRIEDRRTENIRVMTFEPCADVNKEGEARRMAHGEAIFAKAFHLLEATLGEILRIAACPHAGDEFLPECVNRAHSAEGRHRAA